MRKFWTSILALACLCGMMGHSVYANARVTRLEVIDRVSYGQFRPGEYLRIDARIFGELSPAVEPVADVEKVQRNSRGLVEYATRVVLLIPGESARGNGTLLIDVPNRGRAISQSLYNSPRNVVMPLGAFDHGTGFLQDYGYTVASVTWEHGYGIDLPSFVDADGKQRFIEGAALPILRDVADFLASKRTDDHGTANPLAGTINRTIGLGYSQTGRFLKTFLLGGFNLVEGRTVFSGLHIFGAASGHIALRSVVGKESGAGNIPIFADPEVRGVNEEPLAISEIVEIVRKRGEFVPRMVFVNTTTDYFSLRASLGRTGGIGAVEKRLPANVRMYDIAGASHGLSTGTGKCKYPFAILDWHPILRSTLLVLDQWVSKNQAPPPSVFMPLERATTESMALPAPKHLPNAVILVPALDRDGNAVGGIRLPDMDAPLGAHGGQNPPLSFQCSLASSYVAFAKTKEERAPAADPRLSVEERYNGRNDYVNRIRRAARELERQRLLLSEDAAVIVHSAAESTMVK